MSGGVTWVEVAWIAMAAASLTLALIHGLVWLRRRSAYANLMFVVLACSAAAFGGFELAMMHAPSPAAYASTLRWAHVPLALFVLSLVGFVYFYLDAGRRWLALSVIGFRLFGLALNFASGSNVNYREITGIEQLVLWGGAQIATPVGVPNPWTIVPQIGNLLLLIFVIDASISLWRRGGSAEKRRALVVGGSVALCVAAVATLAGLLVAGVVHAPTFVLPGVFIIVAAMAIELGAEVVAAAGLTAQLQASEASFRAVVEAAPSAILLVDRTGRIGLFNGQSAVLFDRTPAQLIGQSIDEMLPGFAARIADSSSAGVAGVPGVAGTAAIVMAARRSDGTEVPVEMMLSEVHTAGGAFTLVSVVDVTERRRGELAERRQRDELAHLSRVAMLGALSGSLAHELNQPLTAILSNAQAAQRFLERDPPALEQVRDIVADIVRNDRRAADVIQRLRALFRKENMPFGAVDIGELVADSLRLMHGDLLSRQVRAVVELPAGLPPVRGDRVQLQQVLLNFVLNGCQAMEAVAGERTLRVRARQSGASRLEVTVSDTGPGFDAEGLKRLFEPFVTTKPQGLGFGLAICRTIIEAHGGRTWASNDVPVGATLHVELPTAEAAVPL